MDLGLNNMDENLMSSDGGDSNMMFSETFSQTFIDRYPLDVNIPYKRLFTLFAVSYLWTLVLTAVPVAFEVGPETYYENHRNWFTGDDVLRIIEPLGGLMLNFLIFYKSGILKKDINRRNFICIMLFVFGGALYVQGSTYHAAANMFKNGLQTIDYDDRDLHDMYYWMRTIWEHIVGHYMYATGYVLMNGCQAFAFKDHKASQLGLTTNAKLLLCLASLVYALLIAGVAADFPSGTIVALIYLVVYGLGVVGGYILYVYRYEHNTKILTFGQRPVLHHFFLSYVLALVLVVAWICSVGGFKSRSQVGIL